MATQIRNEIGTDRLRIAANTPTLQSACASSALSSNPLYSALEKILGTWDVHGATVGSCVEVKMLEYGESYLEQNEAVLEALAEGMSPAAMEFAKEIAASFDEEDA